MTLDDDKVGRVCEEDGDYLIVEHGLFKTKHAVPKTFVEIDDETDIARTTLAKELIHTRPRCTTATRIVQAIAEHYGLARATTIR